MLLLAVVGCARDAPRRDPIAPIDEAPLDAAALAAWLGRSSARPQPAPDGSAEADLARLLPLVARMRGLEASDPPRLDSVHRAELVERAVRWLERQTRPLQRDAQAELLARLELVPADFDLASALRAVLERELSAFYDPDTRGIVIDRDLPRARRRRVLAHELVHALADRHYGLGARLAALDTSDRKAALLTLAEGDAEAVVAELEGAGVAGAGLAGLAGAGLEGVELPGAGLDADEVEARRPRAGGALKGASVELPGVIARSLSASYVDGRAAARRLIDGGGFPALDELYRHPLDGTHQLLAPSFPRITPPAVPPLPLPTPPEPGWTLLHADVLGAQTWRSVLEEWLPAERAAELARGWDGDRLVWFERGRQRLLLWEVRTHARQAAEVAQRMSRALRLSLPQPEPPTARATGFECRAQPDGAALGRWMGERSLSIAALTGAAQSAQCEALAAWTIPATQRRTQRRDLGIQSLIGPT